VRKAPGSALSPTAITTCLVDGLLLVLGTKGRPGPAKAGGLIICIAQRADQVMS
jgi:hypothetical protein